METNAKPRATRAARSNVVPIKAQISGGNSNPSLSGGGGGAGSDHAVDIGKLQTHVGWIAKALGALWLACAVVVGWIVLYLYIPMRDLSQNVAVQTQTLTDVRDDIRDIKDGVKDINARALDDARKSAESTGAKPPK